MLTSPRPIALLLAACGLAACSAASSPPTVVVGGASVSAATATAAADTMATADPKVARAAALANELETLDMAMIGALGSGDQGGLRLGTQGGPVQPGTSGGLQGIGARGGATAAPAPSDAPQKVRGPMVSVSIGGAALSGASIANAASVVAGMAAGFRRCLNKALANDPTAVKDGATIRVTAQIGASGEVLSTSPSATGMSATAIACIAARVSSAQFAPPDGGGTATLVIPMTAQVTQP